MRVHWTCLGQAVQHGQHGVGVQADGDGGVQRVRSQRIPGTKGVLSQLQRTTQSMQLRWVRTHACFPVGTPRCSKCARQSAQLHANATCKRTCPHRLCDGDEEIICRLVDGREGLQEDAPVRAQPQWPARSSVAREVSARRLVMNQVAEHAPVGVVWLEHQVREVEAAELAGAAGGRVWRTQRAALARLRVAMSRERLLRLRTVWRVLHLILEVVVVVRQRLLAQLAASGACRPRSRGAPSLRFHCFPLAFLRRRRALLAWLRAETRQA